VHYVEALPINPEADFEAVVDEQNRKLIACNHSATHLMHAALRKVLGVHVEQKGSLVEVDRLRFDFAHFAKMSDEEIKEVERIVNEKIRENIVGDVLENVPIKAAQEMGAMALFGEKYGEEVRVVAFDSGYSIELCGGTHVGATGNIGLFKIVSESGIAAGVRRIEAVTGLYAERFIDENLNTLTEIKSLFKNQPNPVLAVNQLLEKASLLQKEIDSLQKEKVGQMAEKLFNDGVFISGKRLITSKMNLDVNQGKLLAQKLRALDNNVVVVLALISEDKINLVIAASDAVAEENGFDASAAIKKVASLIKGGGGGQPTMATAGGKDDSKVSEVFDAVAEMLR